MLSPAWVAACTIYNQELLEAGGGDGGSGATSGSGSMSGGTGATGGTSNPGAPGGSDGAGASAPMGGSQGGGGSNNGGGSSGGSSGGDGGDSGDNGGSSGSGNGNGGTAGSGTTEPPKNYTYELIDDFEDGDAMGVVTDTRNPTWFLFYDETPDGVISPDPIEGTPIPKEDADARPDSNMALFISSTGFTDWGSGVGVDFVNPKEPYDASEYAGIRFFAKATSEYKIVRLNVSQVATDASQNVCEKCDDHYGVQLVLTDEWKEYKILFSKLTQERWGDKVPLELDKLLSIMFLVKKNTSVDFWIDDISLMKEVQE